MSCSRLRPAGVASSTATIPTANTPAASLKSRRKASTIAAIASAEPDQAHRHGARRIAALSRRPIRARSPFFRRWTACEVAPCDAAAPARACATAARAQAAASATTPAGERQDAHRDRHGLASRQPRVPGDAFGRGWHCRVDDWMRGRRWFQCGLLLTGSGMAHVVGVHLDRGDLPAALHAGHVEFVGERVAGAARVRGRHHGEHRARARRPVQALHRFQAQRRRRQRDVRARASGPRRAPSPRRRGSCAGRARRPSRAPVRRLRAGAPAPVCAGPVAGAPTNAG